jgi:hypothetical protein
MKSAHASDSPDTQPPAHKKVDSNVSISLQVHGKLGMQLKVFQWICIL